jgi:hypothetical protein
MGQLLKIVIIAIAIGVALLAVRRLLAGRRVNSAEDPATMHVMVQCAHCGTYLPQPQAVIDGEKPYCSEEHRRVASKN